MYYIAKILLLLIKQNLSFKKNMIFPDFKQIYRFCFDKKFVLQKINKIFQYSVFYNSFPVLIVLFEL